MSDPRPTNDFSDTAAWPFRDGAEEIVIRVARYTGGPDLDKIASYQVIVRARNRNIPAGVGVVGGHGIMANPVAALDQAIRDFYRNAEKHGVGLLEQEEIAEGEPEVDDDVDALLA